MVNKITTKEFDEKVLYVEGFVLVKYFTNSCLPCKIMKPIYEDMSTKYKDIPFYEIDVEEEFEIAQRYAIMTVPTIILYKDGECVDRTGRLNDEMLEEMIDKYVGEGV